MSAKKYSLEATESRIPPSNQLLNRTSKPVKLEEIPTPEIQTLIDKLFSVAYGRQGDSQYPTLVGLAAPQIGFMRRIVLIGINAVGNGEQPTLHEYINPVIVYRSRETELNREGCFSTSRICGIVERSKTITLLAYSRSGQKIYQTLDGFPARVAQHEIDHLDGIRFPDRITDDSILHWVEEEEFGDYRIHWSEWPKKCPREKWEAIKSGKENYLEE